MGPAAGQGGRLLRPAHRLRGRGDLRTGPRRGDAGRGVLRRAAGADLARDGLDAAEARAAGQDGLPPEHVVLDEGVASIEDALAASPVVVRGDLHHRGPEPRRHGTALGGRGVGARRADRPQRQPGRELSASAAGHRAGRRPVVGPRDRPPSSAGRSAARADLDAGVPGRCRRAGPGPAGQGGADPGAGLHRDRQPRRRPRQKVALGAETGRHAGRACATTRGPAAGCTGRYVEQTAHSTSREWYASPNMAVSQKMVPLNIPRPRSCARPGEAPGSFALESAMDELAVALDMDPIELRLRNNSAASARQRPAVVEQAPRRVLPDRRRAGSAGRTAYPARPHRRRLAGRARARRPRCTRPCGSRPRSRSRCGPTARRWSRPAARTPAPGCDRAVPDRRPSRWTSPWSGSRRGWATPPTRRAACPADRPPRRARATAIVVAAAAVIDELLALAAHPAPRSRAWTSPTPTGACSPAGGR